MEKTIRALLIEDSPSDARMVVESLAEVPAVQIQLKHALRLQDGLKLLEDSPFDAVLLDLSLPDQTGLETLAAIVGPHPHVPVVILTGSDDENIATKAMHQGAQDYLVKAHISGPLLSHSVRYAIERKRVEIERHRLEYQLQQAQKLESLGVLAGGIAHDFNNLLTSILGNTTLAMMDLWPDSSSHKYLEQVEKAAKRASELTSQMLAYSGRGTFYVRPVDLPRLIEGMNGLLESAISKKANLHYSFTAHPVISGDPAQIQQVIVNLIANASDSLEDRVGDITLSTGIMQADAVILSDCVFSSGLPEGRYAYIEVSDTGKGMDALTRERIFDPFFTTKFAGRGLGLPAVLGIVRGHRGSIQVFSEPNWGTSVTVLFPLFQEIRETPPQPQPETTTGRGAETFPGRCVLVVDDEEYMRTMIRRILEKFGFEVVTARDGREGILRFRDRSEPFDVVLLDMTMPVMNGEEVFDELQKIRPEVPVILSSGYTRQDVVDRLSERGLVHFLQKPYTPSALLEKMRELFDPGV